MGTLEQLAALALDGDPLQLRSSTQDWLRSKPDLASEPEPHTEDPRVRALTAAFAELFAERLGQEPPAWAAAVGPSPEPIFLLRSARTMKRLRESCEAEAPLPLRRRRLYAPANFLQFI